MCKRNGESVNRLFLHCPFASDLWSMVLGLFGVSWVMSHTVLGLLQCWQSFLISYCGVFGGRGIVDVL